MHWFITEEKHHSGPHKITSFETRNIGIAVPVDIYAAVDIYGYQAYVRGTSSRTLNALDHSVDKISVVRAQYE